MQAAGVPIVPGTTVAAPDARVARGGSEIGFPVVVKATAGGGGKGMRVVRGAGELAGALATAASRSGQSLR